MLDLLASCHCSIGNYAKAEPLLRRATDLAHASPDVSLRARIECNHALVLSECGDVEIGRRTIEAWLTCPEVEPHIAALVSAVSGADRAQPQRRRRRARQRAGGAGPPARLASQASGVREFACRRPRPCVLPQRPRRRSRPAVRRRHADASRHRARGEPDRDRNAEQLGSCLDGAGNPPRALELQEEVLRIVTRRSPNGIPPPYAVNNHASTLVTLARFDEGWPRAERTWHIADQRGAALFKLNARVLQATILRERGDLDAASRVLSEVRCSAAELPHDSFAVIGYRQGMANLALRRNRLVEAAEAIEPVIQLFEGRGIETERWQPRFGCARRFYGGREMEPLRTPMRDAPWPSPRACMAAINTPASRGSAG